MAMPRKPELVGPRLRLCAVTEGDAADLHSLDADAEVRRFVDQPFPPMLEDIPRDMIPRWQAFDSRTPQVVFS